MPITRFRGTTARRSSALVLILCTTAAGLAAVEKEPEAPAEVEARYGLDLVPYATVRRSDGSYRRMWTPPETFAAVAAGGPPPEGARILMETYYSPGRVSMVFHMEKVGGRWRYGAFPASSPDLATRPQASCISCHAGAAETDLVYTLPSLRAFASGRGASDFTCARGGRSPCDAETYRRGAPP